MKHALSLFIVFLLCQPLWSQVADTSKTRPAFFLGISYAYLSMESEVDAVSRHSEWYGKDLGTITLDDDELDIINQTTTEMVFRHNLSVEPGMTLLRNNKWHIEGSIHLGMSRTRFETEIDGTENNRKEVTTEFNNLTGGLSFLLRYNISTKWGVTMIPRYNYTWGNSDDITDSITSFVPFFVNDLEETYSMSYGRINFLATYYTNKLTLSAGPGFYYAMIDKEYTIDRTNPETMDQYHDQIESSLHSITFIDACVRADWTFIEPLTLSLEAAAGKDLFIKTGIRYNF